MKYAVEFYHWARCWYLCRYGIPLDAFELAYRITLVEIEALFEIVSLNYLGRMERLDHKRLTPGEQYRQHIRNGGYRL